MPSVAYRRYWLYASVIVGANSLWRDIGCSYWGLVWGRRNRASYPLLAFYIDDGWYQETLNFGLRLGPLDIGVFIDPKEGNHPKSE